jgi:hypothetical protein
VRGHRIAAITLATAGLAGVTFANGLRQWSASLIGYNEVPAVSTVAGGAFNATVSHDDTSVSWELSYADLEGTVTQSHIHVGQVGVNGGISVWLCSNLTSPPTPPGVQPCPAPPATITGTFTAADVVGPTAQGVEPGQFSELLAAIRAGRAYANVHSTKFPGGEVRGQLATGSGHSH